MLFDLVLHPSDLTLHGHFFAPFWTFFWRGNWIVWVGCSCILRVKFWACGFSMLEGHCWGIDTSKEFNFRRLVGQTWLKLVENCNLGKKLWYPVENKQMPQTISVHTHTHTYAQSDAHRHTIPRLVICSHSILNYPIFHFGFNNVSSRQWGISPVLHFARSSASHEPNIILRNEIDLSPSPSWC